MQLIHEMYSDYERLLHANPQRGYDFFYSTLLNPALREPMLTSEASLQAIFCGCNEKGQAIFPNALNINDLLVDEGYMDQALGNYLAFLGYSNPGNNWATFLRNNYTAIFADKAALAAMLQSRTAMQLFVSDATLWAAILANTIYFRRCMCSYYFCAQLAATPTKIGDIRANSSILTAFNTDKKIVTSNQTITAAQSTVFFCMIIGQGGVGGRGGYYYSQSCDTYRSDADPGTEGFVAGTKGKARYNEYPNETYKNAGGGGGRGGVKYCAIRLRKNAKLSCTMSAIPTFTGNDKRSSFKQAANNTQAQILPDIETSTNSTSGTAAANGYGGYGYGAPASGNNFLGTPSANKGTPPNNGRYYGSKEGIGGKGVGAGGGGGAGYGNDSRGYTGGGAAPGCIGLYKGA